VQTPWTFGAGASLILGSLLLSADVDYTDWTELEFDDANPEIINWNAEMKTIFRGAANYRAGAEWDVFGLGLRLRGGFLYNSSPYAGDPETFDKKFITGGIGFQFSGSTMFDLAYAHGWWETFRLNYDNTSEVYEQLTTNIFVATLSYRF
jgi:long-subunit fatty acid transport protein